MEEEETKCEPGAPGWVVTFGDMMSLLLTFFILLLSFSRLEKSRFQAARSSLQKAFGVQNVTPRQSFEDGRSPVMQHFSLPFKASEVVDRLKNIVSSQQSRSPQGKVDIQIDQRNRGVVMTIPYESMFDSGSANLRNEVLLLLDEIAYEIEKHPSQVRVSAFTDNVPIRNSPDFASNDHLSAARSVALINYLRTIVKIPAERFESAPFGPNRPIAPNISQSNRERNRRIEIMFYSRPDAEWKPVKR
jgi:chemotaxis protein MotB